MVRYSLVSTTVAATRLSSCLLLLLLLLLPPIPVPLACRGDDGAKNGAHSLPQERLLAVLHLPLHLQG